MSSDINLLPPDLEFKPVGPNKRALKAMAANSPTPKKAETPNSPAAKAPAKPVAKVEFPNPDAKPISQDPIKSPTPKSVSKTPAPKSQPVAPSAAPNLIGSITVPLSQETPVPKTKRKSTPSDLAKTHQPDSPASQLGYQVNFIESQLSPFHSHFFLNRILMIGVIWAIEVTMLVVGYFAFNRYYLDYKIAEVSEIDQKINVMKSKVTQIAQDRQNVLVFQKKTGAFQGLLSQHLHWSTFFELLESKTLPEVHYSSLSINGTTIGLSGHAPNYANVAKQLTVCEGAKDVISQVKVGQLVYNIDRADKNKKPSISFDLVLTLSPKLLKKSQ